MAAGTFLRPREGISRELRELRENGGSVETESRLALVHLLLLRVIRGIRGYPS